MRWATLGSAVALLATLTASPTTAPDCPGQQVPPVAISGPGAGAAEPEPLPRPVESVGGPGLGACGDLGPAGVPAVGAAAFVLADLDTGEVLAARAPHARHLPASTLKVLTAIVALRRLDPDAVVDGAAEDLAIDGSKAGIGPGGRYTVRQLLEGLLLNSGNDTAQALARAMGGDAATVADMQAVAGGLGALDTRPATPSGLEGPGMTTSAYDLALLFRVAMRDPLFASTTGTVSVPFPGYGDRPGFVLSNTNRLLAGYPGAIGGKAGFTDAARHTLVGAAERGGRRLVVALVRGEQHPEPMWRQAAGLLDWGFGAGAGAAPVGVLVDAAPAVGTSAPDPTTGSPSSDPVARAPAGPDAGAAVAAPLGLAGGAFATIGLAAALVGLGRRRRR